ncbi:MAG: hypothetical protein LEGION0403_FIIPPAGN_01743 [Legionella sp.]|uniref:hypothetical protein n=1 Tax=Legionella sp. TaxID=459 RepID=UPI003D0CD339
MSHLNFFKDFKKTVESLENQAETEHLVQFRQIIAQLYAELDRYKALINNSFDLLWDKRNKYNQLLADSINSSPLTTEQYKHVNKQFKRLDCDIHALSEFIKQVNPEVTIVNYEKRLSALNEQINAKSLHYKNNPI